MDKATCLKTGAEKWKDLKQEERETFLKNKAAEVRKEPLKGHNRTAVIKQCISQISSLCDELQTVGFRVGGLGVDLRQEEKPVIFGSSKEALYIVEYRQDQVHIPEAETVPVSVEISPDAGDNQKCSITEILGKKKITSKVHYLEH